jgi:hypothetical protein
MRRVSFENSENRIALARGRLALRRAEKPATRAGQTRARPIGARMATSLADNGFFTNALLDDVTGIQAE